MSKVEEIKQRRLNSNRGFFDAIAEDAELMKGAQAETDSNNAIKQYSINALPEPAEAVLPPEPAEEPPSAKPKTAGKMKGYLTKNGGLAMTSIRMPVELRDGLNDHKYFTKRRGDRIINELVALYLDAYKDNKLAKRIDEADSFYDVVMEALRK